DDRYLERAPPGDRFEQEISDKDRPPALAGIDLIAGAGLHIADTRSVGADRKQLGGGTDGDQAARAAGIVDKRNLGVQFQPIGRTPTTCYGGRRNVLFEARDKDVPKGDAGNDLEAVNAELVLRPVVVFDRRVDHDLALWRQDAADGRQGRSGFHDLSGLLLLSRWPRDGSRFASRGRRGCGR